MFSQIFVVYLKKNDSLHYEILNELDEKSQSMQSCHLNLLNRIEMPTIVAQELVKMLNKLKHDISQSHFDKDKIDYLNYRLDSVHQLSRKCIEFFLMDSRLLTIMKNVRENFFNDFNHQVSQNYKVPLKKTGFRGRPFLIITKEQLQLYLQYNFTVPKIAKMLLISESTLKCCFQEFGSSVGDTYSDISDCELTV